MFILVRKHWQGEFLDRITQLLSYNNVIFFMPQIVLQCLVSPVLFSLQQQLNLSLLFSYFKVHALNIAGLPDP